MEKLSRWMAKSFRDLAFIDFRALGIFRIALGLVLIADFVTKGFDLLAFYTDRGILPRELAIQFSGWWIFSFHMASGAYWFQAFLWLVGIALALLLILGYQTRTVAVILWFFVVSLQGRNYLVLHAGDALIRLMLFWAMFLPLDARYSLDRALLKQRGEKFEGDGVANVASLAILCQLLFMYFFTAILKDHPEWNRTFEAVYYAMSLEQFTTPFGHFLLAFPGLLKVLTALTYYLEFVGPILLVIPFVQKYIRSAVPFAFMGLHFSLFLCMYLGLFPWICMVCWILFLPSPLWQALETMGERLGGRFRPLRMLADRLGPHLPATLVWRRPLWLKRLVSLFILAALAMVATWNISALPKVNRRVPEPVRNFILPQRLDQSWNMFSPHPMRADGWFVVDGKLRDGSSFDTWNHRPVSWEKPDSFFALYRSTQWRKYLTNVWIEKEAAPIQLAFGRYVCREWNDLSPGIPEEKKLMTYQLYYMRKYTPPPGQAPNIEKVFLWNHNCFGNPEPPPPENPPATRD